MNYITESRTNSQLHFVRLTRNLVGTLKIGFNKLSQDQVELEACPGCVEDKSINFNDRVQLMSLMQFIIHGLEPVEAGKLPIDPAFKKFYTNNKAAVESRVNSY